MKINIASEGLTLNKYNKIINSIFQNLPDLDEWLPKKYLICLIMCHGKIVY